jgi:hypothetical protein
MFLEGVVIFLSSTTSRSALYPTQQIAEVVLAEMKRLKLEAYRQLESRSRILGALPPLPINAFVA